jgi:transposase
MANNPIDMIKIRQILRLQSQGFSKLQIAAQSGIARNTLKKYIRQFLSSGLTFDEINQLNDKELDDLFVKPEDRPLNERLQMLFDIFPAVDKELKKKGVTRQLLWEEYKRNHPDGVGISQFKHYFTQWKAPGEPCYAHGA